MPGQTSTPARNLFELKLKFLSCGHELKINGLYI